MDTLCFMTICLTCALARVTDLMLQTWWPAICQSPVPPLWNQTHNVLPVLYVPKPTALRVWSSFVVHCDDATCTRKHATAWDWYMRMLSLCSCLGDQGVNITPTYRSVQRFWCAMQTQLEHELTQRARLRDTLYDPIGLPLIVSVRCTQCTRLCVFERTDTTGLPVIVTCDLCERRWCTGCHESVSQTTELAHMQHRYLWSHLCHWPQASAWPSQAFWQLLPTFSSHGDFLQCLNRAQSTQLINGLNARLLHFTQGIACASCHHLLPYRTSWSKSTVLDCARCMAETCLHCGGLLCLTGADYQEAIHSSQGIQVANQWRPSAAWKPPSAGGLDAFFLTDERFVPDTDEILSPAQHHERWTEWCDLDDPVPAGRCMPTVELLSHLRWFQVGADSKRTENFMLLRYLQGRCLRGVWQFLFRDCHLSLTVARNLLLNSKVCLGAHWSWLRHWATYWQCAEPSFAQPFFGQPLIIQIPQPLDTPGVGVWKTTALFAALPGHTAKDRLRLKSWHQLFHQQQVFACNVVWTLHKMSEWFRKEEEEES